MTRWLHALVRFLVGSARKADASPHHTNPAMPPAAVTRRDQQPRYPLRSLSRHHGNGKPPRLQWKPSHPSTIARFKAEVTCSQGHGITLPNHTIEADGRVIPSIFCKQPRCSYHEVVRLEGWDAGRILADQGKAKMHA